MIVLLKMIQEGPQSSNRRPNYTKADIGVSRLKLGTSNGAQDSPEEDKRDPSSAKIASNDPREAKMAQGSPGERQDGPKRDRRGLQDVQCKIWKLKR